MEKEIKKSKVSVRNLVEFILRSGDIDNTESVLRDPMEAMQEGSKLHRKIQKERGKDYEAEVPIKWEKEVEWGHKVILLQLEGRADGLLRQREEGEAASFIIEEIKCVYKDLTGLDQALPMHLAQAKCYAAIYAMQNGVEKIGVRMTYCQIRSRKTKMFEETYNRESLEEWLGDLLKEYAKWAVWEMEWKEERNRSIRKVDFPFDYREGQGRLVKGVYLTIMQNKNLFLQAPTGVGKTISTVFPTVKAMGEGLVERIFYLTAKTIARTVALEAFQILIGSGMKLKLVAITAKDKVCIFEKADCNPAVCPRAKGHYDRVNDAVFDLLSSEELMSRELIVQYAEKHTVCPFEMCLDATLWADGVLCDYNYVFDPNVYLKRFFQSEEERDYVFLIDEAHNLVDRAREMYSATLYKQWFLDVKKMVKGLYGPLEKQLNSCNRTLLEWKRECVEFMRIDGVEELILRLMRLMTELEEFMKEVMPHTPGIQYRDDIFEFYRNVKFFLFIYEGLNDKYRIYGDYSEDGEFRLKLQCMDPSDNLEQRLKKGRSAVFFSATLLPVRYYKEQLSGKEGDYAVYAESPFDPSNRLLMVAGDVSSKYTRRGPYEYGKMAAYIVDFVMGKTGNYIVFFPSYRMMEEVGEACKRTAGEQRAETLKGTDIIWKKQVSSMSEEDREDFIGFFEEQGMETRVGFCVMGGIFSEGIDLRSDRLIGAVIVGTGLPMVGYERELFREYYDEKKRMGFEFAYLYPGMNKVLQAAGRVIRTSEDKGAILLLDERFLGSSYQNLFPREWKSFLTVDLKRMKEALGEFWGG